MFSVLMLSLISVATKFRDVPTGGLTLHVSVVPSELHLLTSVPRRIVWPLQQCYTCFVITVDLPHGGKTYGKTRLSAPVYIPNSNIETKIDVSKVELMVEKSRLLLNSHCRHPVFVIVDVLNHSHFKNISKYYDLAGPAYHPNDDPVFVDDVNKNGIHLFKNTFMYTHTLFSERTKYLVHADIDTTGLRTGPVSAGQSVLQKVDFVASAVYELEKNKRLLFVMPSRSCNNTTTYEIRLSTFSCRLFVSMPTRFKSMAPLQYYASHVEDMIMYNMKTNAYTSVVIEGSLPCVASTYLARLLYSSFDDK